MIRQIIHIDEENCNGCGLCADACHEGAIDIIDGKAKLVREHFCDGFGDCLPECPTGAITFEEREAPAYDEEAVNESRRQKEKAHQAGESARDTGGMGTQTVPKAVSSEIPVVTGHGCPGSRMMQFDRNAERGERRGSDPEPAESGMERMQSQLNQWPCQIQLVPTEAPFFDQAKLLIAADCTAYAYARMHEDFMKGKVTLIGCPKLDFTDYTEKLTAIIAGNDVRSVTIIRMEVPCCGGLQRAAENALKNSGKFIPWQVVTVSLDGKILD